MFRGGGTARLTTQSPYGLFIMRHLLEASAWYSTPGFDHYTGHLKLAANGSAYLQMQLCKGSLEEVCLQHEIQVWELVSVLYADIPSESHPAVDGALPTLACYCVQCGMASISPMLLVTRKLAALPCRLSLGVQ